MMSQTTTTASPALKALITWLTRPLIITTPAATVARLRLLLQINLAPLFPLENAPAFSFVFSPTSLPPTPIYRACIASGLSWSTWTKVFGDQVMHFYVSAQFIKMSLSPLVAETIPTLPIWKAETAPSAPMNTKPMSTRLAAALESAQARRVHCESPADSDSDSDSDNESDFSFKSSSSSTATSLSSSPSSSSCDLPSTIKPVTAIYRPKRFTPAHSRSSSTSSTHSAKVTEYVYAGGCTSVFTGGVMLGGGAAKPKAMSKNNSDAASWRARN